MEQDEKKFLNIVKHVPVGITVLRGMEMMVEMANETYLQIIDKKENEFVGKTLFEALPEVRSAVEPILHNVFTTGTPFYGNEFEVSLKRFGLLEKAYFNFVYQPLFENDKTIGGIIVVANEVTKQVDAKHALQESEKQFRKLVTQSPIAMAIFKGRDWVIDIANETLLKNIWRRKLEKVQGKKLLDVFPELEGQHFPQLLKNVFETGIPYKENESIAYINVEDEIKKFYLDFEYAPLHETDKTVSAIMVTVQDVTEKVEARNKIYEAEQSLRLAIEAADMGTFDWDLATQNFFSSERLKEIFGYKNVSNVSHQDLINTFHPEDKHIREQAVKAAFTIGRLKYELRIIWPDKTIHWIRVYGKVQHDAKGAMLRMYGTVIDITEQKDILEEVKENEAKFRLLADSMPQFVWTTDANGRMNYASQSLIDYSGLTVEQINIFGGLVHPDEREENIRLWLEAVAARKDFLIENRFRSRNGDYRWQLTRGVPQKDGNGNIQMWVGTSTDIHDRKLFTDELEFEVQQRTKELSITNNELVRSNNELAQFAYVASHDLQEPLRKIQTFTSLILDMENDNLSAKGKNYFNRVQTASLRMQQLIQDLLSYSRINTEKKHFQLADLNEIVATVKDQLIEKIEEKQATINTTALPVMSLIPYQFEQLFTNLISNSLKFSKKDTPPEIDISTALVNASEIKQLSAPVSLQYHHIAIKDNGIGFEPEYSERIFLVFQRLHSNELYQGTGIGLAICKRIIENHQGIITASGELGKGATFHIYIPAT